MTDSTDSGRIPDVSEYASLVKVFLGSFLGSLLVLAQPAFALEGVRALPLQAGNVCETPMGDFMSTMGDTAGTVAVFVLVVALFIGAAFKPWAQTSQQASKMNNLVSKSFAGAIILVFAIPMLDWLLGFTPFAPTLSCIPFLG